MCAMPHPSPQPAPQPEPKIPAPGTLPKPPQTIVIMEKHGDNGKSSRR